MRPWTLIAWIFLTLGIAMGSYWAYYTLGWGGFWFWDPVENASLMPWLAATALLHSAAVMEKRDALKVWTIFLAILAFSLSLIGTFLVRSGVLTSVHAFASDPQRGVFILVILVFFIGGSLALFACAPSAEAGRHFRADVARRRAGSQQSAADDGLRHGVRRHALSAGARSLDGEKISVGAPFFNATFVPLFLPLVPAHADRPDACLEARRSSSARRSGCCCACLRGLAMMLVLAAWHRDGPLTSLLV